MLAITPVFIEILRTSDMKTCGLFRAQRLSVAFVRRLTQSEMTVER